MKVPTSIAALSKIYPSVRISVGLNIWIPCYAVTLKKIHIGRFDKKNPADQNPAGFFIKNFSYVDLGEESFDQGLLVNPLAVSTALS
jgi:hypothetical protein